MFAKCNQSAHKVLSQASVWPLLEVVEPFRPKLGGFWVFSG